jgi:hypothetical protein
LTPSAHGQQHENFLPQYIEAKCGGGTLCACSKPNGIFTLDRAEFQNAIFHEPSSSNSVERSSWYNILGTLNRDYGNHPLKTRAWPLQERILSRTNIHWVKDQIEDQIAWVCGEFEASTQLESAFRQLNSFSSTNLAQPSRSSRSVNKNLTAAVINPFDLSSESTSPGNGPQILWNTSTQTENQLVSLPEDHPDYNHLSTSRTHSGFVTVRPSRQRICSECSAEDCACGAGLNLLV